MNRIFKELPTVLPFYENKLQQTRFRENATDEPFKLISPLDTVLPFQIEVPATKPNPTYCTIYDLQNSGIQLQLNQFQIYQYNDVKKIIHNGDTLKKLDGSNLNLGCGYYYLSFSFADGSALFSEVFFVPEDSFMHTATNYGTYIKFEFWNESDIEPIIYRNNFRQYIFLDTFVSSFTPEVEEEAEKDGENTAIPTFQKMTMKYRVFDYVPNFVKIALVSMQMHDFVNLTTNDYRSGSLKKLLINVTADENGFMDAVEIVFDDEMLVKTHCNDELPYNNVGTW